MGGAEAGSAPAVIELWPWATLVLLGAFHGVNPAMGWLFAVGLGLQERNRAAVLRALVPIALGHAGAMAAVVAALGVARVMVDPGTLQLVAAGPLVAFGAFRVLRAYGIVRGSRYQTRAGMRVGFLDLALWSFLMATAHGAGLMVIPPLLRLSDAGGLAATSNPHLEMAAAVGGSIGQAVAAVSIHTLAMLAVAGAIALVVFEWVGLAVLRRTWVNLDLLWALALIGAGTLMLVL